MFRKVILLISILCFFSLMLIPQSNDDSVIDSLHIALNNTNESDKKIEIYLKLSQLIRNQDLTKAIEFANQALELAESGNSVEKLGKIHGNLGDLAIASDSINVARRQYEIALSYYEDQNNIDGIITILTILGNIAFTQDDLSKAFQYYKRGIALAEDGNFQKRLVRLHFNIGAVLTKTGQYAESKEYFEKALVAFIELEDVTEVGRAYSNLGAVYLNLGELQTAEEYFNKAMNIYQELNSWFSLAWTYHNLSLVAKKRGEYREAIGLLLNAKQFIEENISAKYEGPRQLYQTNIYIELGNNYLQINEQDSAYYYLLKGLKLGIQNRQLEPSSRGAEMLAGFWAQKGNADSSLYYQILFKAYSDSLYDELNNRKLAYQEAQYKFEQQAAVEEEHRNREADISRRNTIILISAIIVLALFLILMGLLLRLNRTKMKRIGMEQEKLQNELDLKNKELTTYLIYQVKNNEFILSISEKLKQMLWKSPSDNKVLVNEMIREIETDDSGDNWDEFIVRFQQVHTDFYKNLGKRYPELTSNDLRLCAFLKLNMNTKDIAAITYQSQKSISVARWRLRQKLGLKKEERLAAFLAQF